MLQILVITAPIYLCILAGWVATRFGLFKPADMDVLGTFVMHVAMPALLFLSVSRRPLAEVANPTYLAAYTLASLAMLLGGYWWSRRLERTSAPAAAFDALGMGGANSGFVGFPVLLVAMPSVAGVVFGMNVLVESLLTVPLVLFWAERTPGSGSLLRGIGAALGRMLRMPLFAALGLGFVVSGFGITVPEVLLSSFDLLARASTGLALFSVGGMLVGLSVRGHVRRVVVVSVGKLLGMPAAAWASVSLLVLAGMPPLDRHLFAALVLSAAMPSFTSSVVFAARYSERTVPPAVLLVTTAVSFATLSALLAVLL